MHINPGPDDKNELRIKWLVHRRSKATQDWESLLPTANGLIYVAMKSPIEVVECLYVVDDAISDKMQWTLSTCTGQLPQLAVNWLWLTSTAIEWRSLRPFCSTDTVVLLISIQFNCCICAFNHFNAIQLISWFLIINIWMILYDHWN